MQKINIKKLTKEKLAEMYAEAKSAYDAAMDDEERRVRELEEQNKELIALTEKLEANEKALDEMTALYKSADHSAAMLRSRIDEAEKLRDQALEAHGEDMKALEKVKNESRELAHLLGKRELELAEAKQRREDTLRGMEELKGQLKAAEGRAKRKDELLDEALHRLEVEKAIAEDYHESLKWCMAHPWRNLWRCMKEYFRF